MPYLEALESIIIMSSSSQMSHKKDSLPYSHRTINQAGGTDKSKHCFYCDKIHLIVKCDRFLALTARHRSKFVQDQPICPRCLHRHPKSPSKQGCEWCRFNHDNLLHFGKKMKTSSPIEKNSTSIDDQQESKFEATENAADQSHAEITKNSKFSKKESDSSSSASTSSSDNELPTHLSSCFQNSNKTVSCGILLATAIVKVKGDSGIDLLVIALVEPYS